MTEIGHDLSGKFNLSMTSDKVRNRGAEWLLARPACTVSFRSFGYIGDRRRCGSRGLFRKTDKVSIQPSGLTAQNLAVPFSKTVLKIDSEFVLYFDGF